MEHKENCLKAKVSHTAPAPWLQRGESTSKQPVWVSSSELQRVEILLHISVMISEEDKHRIIIYIGKGL